VNIDGGGFGGNRFRQLSGNDNENIFGYTILEYTVSSGYVIDSISKA
jgi:hypothetical protein